MMRQNHDCDVRRGGATAAAPYKAPTRQYRCMVELISIGGLFLAFFLVVMNGVFVAAEFAFVKIGQLG